MFNKNLFAAVRGGTALQSPSLTKASSVKTKAQNQILRLRSIYPSEDPLVPSVDEVKKENCILALQNSGDGADVLKGHINSTLDNFMENMNLSAMVKEIDAFVGDVPPACVNINTIAGAAGGAADALLSEAESIIDELEQGITSYNADQMELDDFHDLLDRVADELGFSVAGVLGLVQNEVETLNEMRETHKAYCRAQSMERLINDDCVRPLLYKLSGPTLADALTADFGLSDVVEGLS